MTRFTVYYRRSVLSHRTYRITVTATSPDEARAKARIRDPLLVSTTKVKNLGSVVSGRFEAVAR